MKMNKPTVRVENKVNEPKVWDIVTHGGFEQKSKNYPCDVIIESGDYLNEKGEVVNQWQWRRILPDFKLGKVETGSGDFYVSENQYNKLFDHKKGKLIVDGVTKIKRAKVDVPYSTFNGYIF